MTPRAFHIWRSDMSRISRLRDFENSPVRRRSIHTHRALKRACDATLVSATSCGSGRLEALERRVLMAVDPVIVYAFEDAATGTAVEDTSAEGVDNDGRLRGD